MPKRQVIALAAAILAVATAGGAASASALPRTAPAAGHTRAAQARPPGLTVQAAGTWRGDPSGPGCGYTKAVPFDSFKGLPNFTKKKAARRYVAVMHTTQGVITVRMLTAKAPCTTYSFRFLAQRGYFNGTHCHRLTVKVIFVLQCGDPTGTGSGAPGYRFNDENLAGANYAAGTVAMANAGPNTNGSQFFFCWKNSGKIPPAYTPFGRVIGGMAVLQKIAAAGDDSQNGPGDGYPHRYVGFQRVQIVFGSK
jgi:peptidyl-prolyl cis-trans isomerase B (cyclophilin B)